MLCQNAQQKNKQTSARKGSFGHWLRVVCIVQGKTRWQKLEAAGHVYTHSQKEERDACWSHLHPRPGSRERCMLELSSLCPLYSAHGMAPPALRGGGGSRMHSHAHGGMPLKWFQIQSSQQWTLAITVLCRATVDRYHCVLVQAQK